MVREKNESSKDLDMDILDNCIEKIEDLKFLFKDIKEYIKPLDKIIDLLSDCVSARNAKETLLETKIYLKLVLIEEIIENDEEDSLIKIKEVLNEITILAEKRKTKFL
ncbi:MAG: hypothetical protein IJX17_04905 [Clostridia bacterium]|nr:hypothetical protein [Clostridia bacterium]